MTPYKAVLCVVGLPGLEPVVLTASLKHHFEAIGGNIVQITFEDTEVKVTGGIGGILVGSLDLQLLPCKAFLATAFVLQARVL